MSDDKVYCEECGWKGNWTELITFRVVSMRELCPDCGSEDITEGDSVGSDEYLKQERRDRPTG